MIQNTPNNQSTTKAQAKMTTHAKDVQVIGIISPKTKLPLPLFTEKVAAGFPSPAQDYIENAIDLNELLIKHPNATYLVRAGGCSMEGMGIYENDILIVDRALEAKHKDVVIASVYGAFTCKQLILEPEPMLKAYHPSHKSILLNNFTDEGLNLFGVVTSVIKQFV